jgi:hypothetical protein
MSKDLTPPTSRREFLGAAAKVTTAATLAAPALVAAADQVPGAAPGKPVLLAQAAAPSAPSAGAAAPPVAHDWTKPAAMSIPKEGYFKKEEGRYGPIYPRTPANYGFTIIAKVKPGKEATIREYGKKIEALIKEEPFALAPLRLHYLRWVLFDVGSGMHFIYQGIFDTDFDKYLEDALAIFAATGVNTVFENLEGFPVDWKTNAPAVIKFFRDHQRSSFLEYAEYPYVTADEVKKALRVKDSMSSILDQMQ